MLNLVWEPGSVTPQGCGPLCPPDGLCWDAGTSPQLPGDTSPNWAPQCCSGMAGAASGFGEGLMSTSPVARRATVFTVAGKTQRHEPICNVFQEKNKTTGKEKGENNNSNISRLKSFNTLIDGKAMSTLKDSLQPTVQLTVLFKGLFIRKVISKSNMLLKVLLFLEESINTIYSIRGSANIIFICRQTRY